MLMLIDTHAHVNFKQFDKDREETIGRALGQKIWMVNVGADYKTSEEALKITQIYTEGVYAAVGAHPTDADKEEFNFERYEKLALNKKVVAVGETGLDYFHNKDKKERAKQEELFLQHLDLARRVNKPLILHCRDAHKELLEILKNTLTDERGIIHCFSGTWEEAKEYLELGLLIGLNGIITFSTPKAAHLGGQAHNYDEIIKKIPMESIVLETDCPYLTPIPFRGERNEPAYVKYVAEKIAEIKNLSFVEVANITTENAKALFKLE